MVPVSTVKTKIVEFIISEQQKRNTGICYKKDSPKTLKFFILGFKNIFLENMQFKTDAIALKLLLHCLNNAILGM